MSDFLFKKWHMRRLGIANWKGYRVGRQVWHYNLLTLILPLPLSDQFCLGSSISERIGLAPGQHAGTLKSMSTHGSARPDAPPCIGEFSLPPRFAQDLSKTGKLVLEDFSSALEYESSLSALFSRTWQFLHLEWRPGAGSLQAPGGCKVAL